MNYISQVSSAVPATADALHAELFTSFDNISITHSEWDEFIESVGGEIFLTYDWCRTWWKYYGDGRQLMICIFRDSQNSLCGVMPVFSETFGFGPASVRVVKMVGSDFMPITFAIPVREEMLEIVTHAFLDLLNEKCHWDLLYLGAICGRYPAIEGLVNAFKAYSNYAYHVDVTSSEVQTYYDVANSWDEQIAGLSRKQRQNIRRVHNELQKASLTPNFVPATKFNFPETFSTFVQVHQQQWNELGMPGHFIDWPCSIGFHSEIGSLGIDSGRTKLFTIKLNDEVIGYNYLYKFGSRYQWYLSGRSHYENDSKIDFQRISFRLTLQSALSEQVTSIDDGRGRYEYKMAMGGKLTNVNNVYVESREMFSRMKLSVFYLLILTCNVLYSKVWRRRIAPRMGFRPRPLFSWWIKTHMLSRIEPTRGFGKLKTKLGFLN